VVHRTCLGRLAIALLGAAFFGLCRAQPQPPTTENQARYYVYGAFLTHAVPEIMGQRVALGPELEQRLGLAPGADRLQIYDALMSYTDGKRLAVRKATAAELATYKRELRSPVFTVQAGEIALLVEYDMQANTIPFVGQLSVAPQAVAPAPKPVAPPAPVAEPAPKPVAPPPVATPAPKPAAPTVAAVVPRPAPMKPAPTRPAPVRPAPPPVAAPAEPLKPNGPCIVTPVMSEQDLVNCRAAPGRAARVEPGPPIVAKPQARVAPPPAPRRTGPCEVKPVMSEEDLANCRAVGEARRIEPGPPVAAKPQPRAEPVREPVRARPCEIKPVMSAEDLAACGIRQ
jgi:hypothetical protein